MPPFAAAALIRVARERLLRVYVREAARLRAAAANATTASLRARLLEEAEQQEQLADKISKLDGYSPSLERKARPSPSGR